MKYISMSRLAKKPVIVPSGVSFQDANGVYTVKGPKGELKKPCVPKVTITAQDDKLIFSVPDMESSEDKAYLGTAVRVVQNLIKGVTEGFQKQLEINGVGFRAEVKGKNLVLAAGYSHPVEIKEIPGIIWQVEKNIITVSGIDKVLVGQVAANIRKVRKPEPYKGKGIKYVDEVIIRKEGKQVKSEG